MIDNIKANAVYGAIAGDIIGSIYESNPCLKDKVYKFPLWTGKAKLSAHEHESQRTGSRYTDDTVTGLALAKACMKLGSFENEETVKEIFAENMRDLCVKYEWAGYGSRFWIWLTAPKGNANRLPYNSYGNGSAMRVFPIGLLFSSLEETQRVARLSAEISHNHEQGIKGAQAVASVMFLARTGKSKNEIRRYVIETYADDEYYHMDKSCDEIRQTYSFDLSCQGSVPESIQCFLEGNSYEECVRLAVSLGGDADTMGCITGAMAACMYPVPKKIIKQVQKRLPEELIQIIDKWNNS